MKSRIAILAFVVLGVTVFFLMRKSQNKSAETTTVIEKRIEAHQTDVAMLNKQWTIIHEATRLRKNWKIEEAIALYRHAANIGDPSTPRLILLEIYEKIGRYDEALVIVDWLLKNDQNEQGRIETLKIKMRLLDKKSQVTVTGAGPVIRK